MKKKNVIIVTVLLAVLLALYVMIYVFNLGQTPESINTSSNGNNGEQNGTDNEDSSVKTNGQGQVYVAIDFIGPPDSVNNYIVFEVALDTHTIDLDEVDLGEMTTLEEDTGLVVEDGILWEVKRGSGHHISGYLKVPYNYSDGGKFPKGNYIILTIRDLGGARTRKFLWNKTEL